MQLFEQACILTYSKPKTDVFLALYIEVGISLFSGKISTKTLSNVVKLLLDYPNLHFTLNNFIKKT